MGDGVFLHGGSILFFPIRYPDSSITGGFVVVPQLSTSSAGKGEERQSQACQTLTGRKLVTDQMECVDAATCPGKRRAAWAAPVSPKPGAPSCPSDRDTGATPPFS